MVFERLVAGIRKATSLAAAPRGATSFTRTPVRSPPADARCGGLTAGVREISRGRAQRLRGVDGCAVLWRFAVELPAFIDTPVVLIPYDRFRRATF